MTTMTYEQFLDEVTTLLTELYDMSERQAIDAVMRAQATDYFTLHDDMPEMRTQRRAEMDAKEIARLNKAGRPKSGPSTKKKQAK